MNRLFIASLFFLIFHMGNAQYALTDTFSRDIIFEDGFDNNEKKWLTGEFQGNRFSISNGLASIRTNSNGNFSFFVPIEQVIGDKDFEIEFSAKITFPGDASFMRLFFCESVNAANTATLYGDKTFCMGAVAPVTLYTDGKFIPYNINYQAPNVYKFTKIANTLSFSLNGRNIYSASIGLFPTKQILIMLSSGTEMDLNYFKVFKLVKPIISQKLKAIVEGRINEWQQKGEFEKSIDYRARVNEANRAAKIEQFQAEALKQLKQEYLAAVNFEKVKLGTYDADNESFLLSSQELGEFVVPVPIADAPAFKQNFSSRKFLNPDFYLQGGQFVLSYADVVVGIKKYTYNSKARASYTETKIDYKFEPIKLDMEENLSAGGKVNKAVNNISVGKSDVDVDIPAVALANTHRYALIIGNEDYSSFQSGLSSEVNVDYAINDARVFKEYCIKTLGIPEKQIKLLTNATTGQMNQGIAWLNNLAKVDNGNAELIVYYSGHGLPDEATKEPYLIPVDVSGNNVTQGIPLNTVYGKLTEFPAQKVTVFLDACFSGGARNQALVAMKGVKIKPKDNVLNGNMVVFASSSGEESSGVYRDKQHGYMTYYLLKKLQESKGDITYSQLADYVTQNVKKETALNGKIQTPQVIYSTSVADKWIGWKVK